MAAITVNEAMTHDPIMVDLETSLEDIATLMVKNDIHTLPVLDQGNLVGIIGKGDILRTLISAKLLSGNSITGRESLRKVLTQTSTT